MPETIWQLHPAGQNFFYNFMNAGSFHMQNKCILIVKYYPSKYSMILNYL